MTVQPSPENIMQVGLGFWGSRVLLSAVELQLFTVLSAQPLNETTLRGRLGLHERSSRDFFDALVSMGFLQREDGVYSNTSETDLFLDRNKPSYVGGILEMASHRLFRIWNSLPEALQTGELQSEAKGGGQSFFATLYSEPERLREFLSAMTGLSRPANMAIAKQFPWADYKTFVDVGTAQGDLAVQVALANPHLQGQGFDLPEVGPVFNKYVETNHLADRVTFSAGSFFDVALPTADVIMMGHILHDWNLAEKQMLISKAHNALPDGGALIVYESIIDDDRRQNTFGLLMSINMLLETEGGFDYTGADCCGWMKEAGFRETRVEHLVGPDSMVVGIK